MGMGEEGDDAGARDRRCTEAMEPISELHLRVILGAPEEF